RPTSSFTIAAQPLAAGDQMTGRGPLVSGFGQSCVRGGAAAPDALRGTRTDPHWSPTSAFDSLNVSARSVSSVTFSGETAMSTVTQSGSKPGVPVPSLLSLPPTPLQAAAVVATTSGAVGAGAGS